jgi:hypothetical protein
MAKSEGKRTRDCPPYKSMYEQSQHENDRLKAEVSYAHSKLQAEMAYSSQLVTLLRKKAGGGS